MAGNKSPIVPKSHTEIVRFWRQEITAAEERRQNRFDKQAEVNRRHYLGDYSDEFRPGGGDARAQPGTHEVTSSVSMVFSTNKTIVPYLVHKNPTILAKSERSPNLARCCQEFAGYLHREQPYKQITKSVVACADLYGMSCVFSYFDPIRGLPARRRVSMKNIVVNVDADEDYRNIDWIAERFSIPVRKARADKTLNYRDAIVAVKETERDNRSDWDSKNEDEKSQVVEEAIGWRIWIRNESPGLVPKKDPNEQKPLVESEIGEVKNRVITIFEKSPYVHQDIPWPNTFDTDEFPYTFLRYNFEESEFYGFSSYSACKNSHSFMNWLWSFILRRIRSSCTNKILISNLLEENLDDLRSGEDMNFIPVNDENVKRVEELIKFVEFPELKAELINMLNIVKNTWDEVIGVTSYMRGGLPASGSRSATQAEIEDDRAQNRIDEMLDVTEDFLSTLARKDLQIAAAHIPVSDRIEIQEDIHLGQSEDGMWMPVEGEEAALVSFREGEVWGGADPEVRDILLPLLQLVGGMDKVKVLQRGMSYFLPNPINDKLPPGVEAPPLGSYWVSMDPVKDAETIRREIYVQVEHGTTRKVNKNQMIQDMERMLQTLAPVYLQLGLFDKVATAINKFIDAFDISDDGGLRISASDLQAMGPQAAMALAQTTVDAVRKIQDGNTSGAAGRPPMERMMESGQQGLSRSATGGMDA